MNLFSKWFGKNKGLVEDTNISAGLFTPFIMALNHAGFSYDFVQRNYPQLYNQFIGLGKSCMEFRAINFAQHKQILYRQITQTDLEEVELNHPAVEFLQNMNPEFTNEEVKELKMLNEDIIGNCYWLIQRNQAGYPKEIWNLVVRFGYSIQPLFTNGVITSYLYDKGLGGQRTEYDAKDIIHFRQLNPSNPYIGIGKLAGNPYAFDMENTLNVYQKSFIENDATGRVWIKVNKSMDTNQRKQFLDDYNRDYKGAKKAGMIPALADADMKSLSLSPKEMDYVSTQELFQRKIISTFRVHPQLLGLTQDVNKSNGISALSEWHNVHLKPIVNSYDAKMTKFIRLNYKDASNFVVKTIIEPPDDRQQTLKELELDTKLGSLRYNEYRKYRGYDPIFKLDAKGRITNELDTKGFEFIQAYNVRETASSTVQDIEQQEIE